MDNKCVILLFIYKYDLYDYEQLSLKQCFKLFYNKYDICAVIPNDFNIHEFEKKYEVNFNKTLIFESWLFNSLSDYNRLMMFCNLPNLLKDSNYTYCLIYHLDAFCFNDNLEYYIKQNYDFLGGLNHIINIDNDISNTEFRYIMNGGLSLRNIDFWCNNQYNEISYEIIRQYGENPNVNHILKYSIKYNELYEDIYYSLLNTSKIKYYDLMSFSFSNTLSNNIDIHNYNLMMIKTFKIDVFGFHGIKDNKQMLDYCEKYFNK